MQNKYKSPIAAAVHQTIADLYDSGLVLKRQMRSFNESCLIQVIPQEEAAASHNRQKLTKKLRIGISQ